MESLLFLKSVLQDNLLYWTKFHLKFLWHLMVNRKANYSEVENIILIKSLFRQSMFVDRVIFLTFVVTWFSLSKIFI